MALSPLRFREPDMLDADAIQADITKLEQQRAQAVTAVQQIEGALKFARSLLARANEPKPVPPPETPPTA